MVYFERFLLHLRTNDMMGMGSELMNILLKTAGADKDGGKPQNL
jgi:hypothetical protein